MFKKLIVSAVSVVGLLATPGAAQTWNCGSGNTATSAVTATFASGTLTVSGTGAMINYELAASRPWQGVRTSITTVIIEDGVTTIGNNAFMLLPSLKSVTIGNSVTTIGEFAFSGCTSLEKIVIPHNVTTIGESAFRGCTALKSAELGVRVANIGDEAFYSCTQLSGIVSWNSTPPTLGRNVFSMLAVMSLYVPKGSESAYRSAWPNYFVITEFNANASVRYHVDHRSSAAASRVTVRNRTLTVRPSSPESVSRVQLIDMRGKPVASFTARGAGSFSLGNIPAGRYFVEVREGARRERGAVVVGVR